MEVRLYDANITSTEKTDTGLKIEGYVNETENWSQPLGGRRKFVEKIKRGAFFKALTRAKELGKSIDLLFEHDTNNLLGSTCNNSLRLEEDERGLRFNAEIIDTTLGNDVYKMIRSGLVSNMSFGFVNPKDEWVKGSSGIFERTINDLELLEVSIVKNPAYLASNVLARNLEINDSDCIPEDLEEEELKNDENESKTNDKTNEKTDKTNEKVEEKDKKTEEISENKPKNDEKTLETEKTEEVDKTEEVNEEDKKNNENNKKTEEKESTNSEETTKNLEDSNIENEKRAIQYDLKIKEIEVLLNY